MKKAVLMDEFHLAVFAPRGLPAADYAAIRRTLNARRFRAALRGAVQQLCRWYPPLRDVRITVTR